MDTQTPSEFIIQAMTKYEEENHRKPVMMVCSSDVIRDLYKELKRNGSLPKGSSPFSIALILRKPIHFAGCEVILCGGSKRMALL